MLKYIAVVAFLALVYAERKAIVTLSGGTATGNIYFQETDDGVHVTGTVSGLTEGKHGFHIHAVGDISGGCLSTLGHFNPHNVDHADRLANQRHVGDLGNIDANATGTATIDFVDSVITLNGEHNIIGRGVVVHAGEDDLGLGGQNDSKTTGHAGGRVGCGVIGTLSGSGAERPMNFLMPSIMIALVIFFRLF